MMSSTNDCWSIRDH